MQKCFVCESGENKIPRLDEITLSTLVDASP